MELCPLGALGELFIGGVGVARGYLNRPDLTAERFVPDPFSHEPGARLYRSGDLASRLPDGNIEFVGRSDHQIKIRGYRVELGEIETALRRHQAVVEAVAVMREDSPGDRRIVAYISCSERAADTDSLRDYIKKRIPDYMIPSAFVFVDSWPLNSSGKIDREKLPSPNDSTGKADYIAPRTPIEKRLAEIWVEILHVKQVGSDDNFFHLGGHSLLGTQLISRVREAFEVDLPLKELFTGNPTLTGLSLAIEQRLIESASAADIITELDKLNELSDEEVKALLSDR
jgi:hypothetical protein